MKPSTLVSLTRISNEETAFSSLFEHQLSVINEEDVMRLPHEDIVILFRGGEDIHPSLYNEKRVPESMAPFEISRRDQFEKNIFAYAKQAGIPMLGICRGAQMLCALSGGKLVQHVTGHSRTHPIITNEGKTLEATSTHHQMLYPWDTKYKLLAWAIPALSKEYKLNPEVSLSRVLAEPEVVFFPETKALAIQGHPEYLTQTNPYVTYCNDLVKEYLL